MPVTNYQDWQDKGALASVKGNFAFNSGNGSWASSTLCFISMYSTLQKSTHSADVPDNPGICDHNSTGALIRTPTLPGESDKPLFLSEIEFGFGHSLGSPPRTVGILYDRLYHMAGMSGLLTTEQPTGMPTPAMNRYTDGEGVQIWLEIYSSIGTPNTVAYVTYTNSKGVAGRVGTTAFAVSNFSGASMTSPVSLAPGDTGVQSVQSVRLGGAGTSQGNFGVTLVKPLAITPIDNTAQVERLAFRNMLQGGGAVEIKPNACLALHILSANTSTTNKQLVGRLGIIEG